MKLTTDDKTAINKLLNKRLEYYIWVITEEGGGDKEASEVFNYLFDHYMEGDIDKFDKYLFPEEWRELNQLLELKKKIIA